jgi:hypothetical protein
MLLPPALGYYEIITPKRVNEVVNNTNPLARHA